MRLPFPSPLGCTAAFALLCVSPACTGASAEGSGARTETSEDPSGDGDGDDSDPTDTSMGEQCPADEVAVFFELVLESYEPFDWDLLCTVDSLVVTDEGKNMLDLIECESQNEAEPPAELSFELRATGSPILVFGEGEQLRLHWVQEVTGDFLNFFTLRDAESMELLVAGAHGPALVSSTVPDLFAPLELADIDTDCMWVPESFGCGFMSRSEIEVTLGADSIRVLDGLTGTLDASPGYRVWVGDATHLQDSQCDDGRDIYYDYLIMRE